MCIVLMVYILSKTLKCIPHVCVVCRDAPEATGDEPEDADFDMPKIYEPVRKKNTFFFFQYNLLNNNIFQLGICKQYVVIHKNEIQLL